MTMYKRNRKQLAMRIFCALLLGTCLLGGHQPVSADVATLTTNSDNRNISVNTNSGSVEITLSGTAKDPKQTALGNGAKATGNLATAIGAEAEATEQTSTALGNAAKAKGVNATAVGHGAYATLGGSALGHFAYARGDYSVAFGFEAQTGTDSTPADGTEAIAIGYSAKAQKQRGIAIGSDSRAEEENATALGYKAVANGKNALALGYNARAHLENSVAIGYNSSVGAVNSVSFGSSGATRRLMYVSAGESNTDAANFGQLLKSASLNGSKLEFYTNAFNKSFDVDLSSAGFTDKYTTGVTLTGNTVTFTRNDGGTYSFDLPASAGGGGMSSLKFAGDDGPIITKTDGEELEILGGASPAALSENNIGVASESGALKIKLAKDITGISSLTTESGLKIDAAGKITGVKDGTADSDAVNVKQLKNLDKKMTGNTNAIAANKADIAANKADIATNKAGIAANQAAISGIKAQNGVVASTGTAKADEFVKGTAVYDYLHGDTIALGKGSTATGMNSIAIGFGNQVKGKGSGAFGDPTTITGSGSYSVGNNNTIGGDNTFVLGNNVNTTANNAVVLGNNSEGVENAVSVGAKGNERQIKNVADGTADSDAVTVRQLNKVAGFDVNTIDADLKAANTRITRMDSKVNKVGAGAAALAALHPLDMDNKFDVAAGFGNYRNANALALGVFYRPAENVMFSAGGAMGNGENMVNVGVTFALDKGEGVRVSKAAMAKKINALTDENAAMKEKLAAQDTEIGALKAALARLEAKMK